MKSRHDASSQTPAAGMSRRHVLMMMALGLALCVPASAPAAGPVRTGTGRTPVVCFSMPETDSHHGMTCDEENSVVVIDGKVPGNTQYVAQPIQEMTGADIFRIMPQQPHPRYHRTLIDLTEREQKRGARPAIAGTVEDIDDFDTVFIGYPNWRADMPMILYTFLDRYDLSGKTIVPFCSHGGNGLSRTVETIRKKQPGANFVRNGFALSRSRMEQAPSAVAAWLKLPGLAGRG